MSKSAIEWTDETWNPVTGCDKYSTGCKHCYAETMLGVPLKWKKPRMCFVCSMSDLFHKNVPNEYIAAVFGVIAACPDSTFQMLTKRAERLPEWFAWLDDHGQREWQALRCQEAANAHVSIALSDPAEYARLGWPLPNVWIGVSVENRKHGLPRIEHLRRTPAAVRFLSIEPLLEDLGDDWSLDGIDWVIVGGESGHGARPMHPAWVRRIRDKVLTARQTCLSCAGSGKTHRAPMAGLCALPQACSRCLGRGWTGPALFFKQWGAWTPIGEMPEAPFDTRPNEIGLAADGAIWRGPGYRPEGLCWRDDHGEALRMRNVGKGKAGRELDERTWDEMPGRVA